MPTSSAAQVIAQNAAQSAKDAYFAHLIPLEIVSALLSTFFIAMSIYFLVKSGWLENRVDRVRDVILKSDVTKQRVQSSWNDIERHFFAGNDNDLRIALIEADTLLDEALRGAGVQGTLLGDRLKKVTPAQLPNIEDVWGAHKLRNRIAHETDFVLKRDLAERALTIYETALEHLGVLDSESSATKEQPHSPPSP